MKMNVQTNMTFGVPKSAEAMVCLQSDGTCLIRLLDGRTWRGLLTTRPELSSLWEYRGSILASMWLLIVALVASVLLLLCDAFARFERISWAVPAGVMFCMLGLACASLALTVIVRGNVARLSTTRMVVLGTGFYLSIFCIVLCVAWATWAMWEWLRWRGKRPVGRVASRSPSKASASHFHREGEACRHSL